MSINKVLGILVFGVCAVVLGSYFHSNNQSASRKPSSVRFGKSNASFQVKIIGPSLDALPTDEDNEIILSADVVALSQVQGDLKYQWIVNDPDQVFDKASLTGEFVGVQKGQQIKDISLRLSGFSKTGAPNRVTLQVWSENGAGVDTYAPFDNLRPSVEESISFKTLGSDNQPKKPVHQ